MRNLAFALLAAGAAAMLYAFTMDTSVSIRDRVTESGVPAGMAGLIPAEARATDPGRVDRRQTFLLGGGVLAVIGTVLLVAGTRRPQTA